MRSAFLASLAWLTQVVYWWLMVEDKQDWSTHSKLPEWSAKIFSQWMVQTHTFCIQNDSYKISIAVPLESLQNIWVYIICSNKLKSRGNQKGTEEKKPITWITEAVNYKGPSSRYWWAQLWKKLNFVLAFHPFKNKTEIFQPESNPPSQSHIHRKCMQNRNLSYEHQYQFLSLHLNPICS